jgi:hypothetical protein
MAELYNMKFSGFSIPPPHLEPKMEMRMVEFFLSGLVCLINRWMEHITPQTGRSTAKNSEHDPQILHTYIHTHIGMTIAKCRLIHE